METSLLVMSDSSLDRHTTSLLLEGCTNRPSVDHRRAEGYEGYELIWYDDFGYLHCVFVWFLGALDEYAGQEVDALGRSLDDLVIANMYVLVTRSSLWLWLEHADNLCF